MQVRKFAISSKKEDPLTTHWRWTGQSIGVFVHRAFANDFNFFKAFAYRCPASQFRLIFEDQILADFEEISSDHIFRLLYIVRNAACCRSLKDFKDDFNQSYWILIFNNFFDIAILEWCKVFGTYSEPTHWTRLVNDHDSFKQGLLARLGLNDSEWDSYGKYIRDYRNNFIAHHRKDPKVTNYPDLDKALEVAFYYYEWLLYKLDELGIQQQPESLKNYYEYCLDQSKRFTEKAYSITKELGENIF